MYCSTVHAKNCYFLYTVPVLCPVVAYLERRKRYVLLSEFNTITITYSMTLVNKCSWNTSYFIYEILFESNFQFKIIDNQCVSGIATFLPKTSCNIRYNGMCDSCI